MIRGRKCTGGTLPGMGWIGGLMVPVMAASLALAQLPTATILGAVKDSSGAVVPGAAVTARNVDTGQTRAAVTGADGSYRFNALPVGNYEVRVEHAGFQTDVRSGLTLTVAQEAVVNFTLEVGAVQQTVSVTAEAPLVNTSSGSLGALVDEQKVADLPLNGRNYINLTLLQPGIQQHGNKSSFTGGMAGIMFSSNGAPIRSNNFLLDGASMVTARGDSSSSATDTTLGVEGIREYRVVTNSFSAEYGMTMGSQMTIVSKSGTNTFHGSLFEYLRNSALDARNFFDYKTAATPRRLPAFTRNNFGGSFGGPIKKDKTFFFGVFEALRERKGITSVISVIPSAAKVDGGLVPQIAPVVKPFLQFFPDPNLPGGQFTFPFSQPNTENYGQMRVDQTISPNDTAFVRYTIDDDNSIQPYRYPLFALLSTSRGQFSTLSENHVFSPALLNTFRFSFSRFNWGQFNSGEHTELTGPQFSFVPGLPAGQLNIGGVMGWGLNGPAPNAQRQNLFTWSDDMFYTRGRHALKFGALINHYQQNLIFSLNLRGALSFANLTTFLQGQPSSYVAILPGSSVDRTYHHSTLGYYLQDDVRVLPNLMLNLGLRYEFYTTFQESHGLSAAMRNVQTDLAPTIGPLFKNPSLRSFSPRFGFAWDVSGNGQTAIRGGFGILYDLGNLSSALFQATCSPPFCNSVTVANPPPLTLPLKFPVGAAGSSLKGLDYSLGQPHLLSYNLTLDRHLPWDMALTLAYAGSRGLNLMQITEGDPTVPQILPDGQKFWTGSDPRINPNWATYELHTAGSSSWYNSLQFGLLKRVGKGLQFQSAYTWSKTLDLNQAQQTDTDTSSAFPADPSNIKLEKGLAEFNVGQSWHLNAIYQFPELASKGSVMGNLLNGWGMKGILSLQSGLPFSPMEQTNRSRSGVNGGASAPALSASSDRPDLVLGRNNSNITQGASTGCPGVPAGVKLGTPNLWYDPCAFTLQPAGFLGTAGRDILHGPGVATLDFSVTKDTPLRFLGESGKLEFRAEIFNILNRANFSTPSAGGNNNAATVFAGTGNVGVPLASTGVITTTSTTSRQIQLALKILF